MSTKKQLKNTLQLESVAFINSILKAAGRNKETLRSPEISEADELLVHAAQPYLKSGSSLTEAVRLAEGEIRGQEVEQAAPETAITINQVAKERHSLVSQKGERIVFEQAIQQGTELAQKAEILKWAAFSTAISSAQVQESAGVLEALEAALSIQNGEQANESHLDFFSGYLQQTGFFTPALQGERVVAALQGVEQEPTSGSADY